MSTSEPSQGVWDLSEVARLMGPWFVLPLYTVNNTMSVYYLSILVKKKKKKAA